MDMDYTVTWSCQNPCCDSYEIPVELPVNVGHPICSDCEEALTKDGED